MPGAKKTPMQTLLEVLHMSDGVKTLPQMVASLQRTIDKMTTQAAHQSLFLRMLEDECDSPEQEALLFALISSNAVGFEWRIEVDRQIEEITARVAALEVAHV